MTIRALHENGRPMTPEDSAAPPSPPGRHWTGIAVSLLFLSGASGLVLYFTFAPTLCPAEYRGAASPVTAPANGEIVRLKAPGPVRAGEIAAVLRIPPNADPAFVETLNRTRDRLRELGDGANRQAVGIKQSEMRLAELADELEQAETELAIARRAELRAEREKRRRTERRTVAERLLELEAIRNRDCEAARESADDADDEAARIALQRRKAEKTVAALGKKLERERSEHTRAARENAARENAARQYREQLERSLDQIEFRPDGVHLPIFAGADGILTESHLTAGSRVRGGDPVSEVLPEHSATLAVYVPEDEASDITLRGRFRVSLGGRAVVAEVERLAPNLDPLPARLRPRARRPDGLYRKIVLKIPPGAPAWLDGQTGEAIRR